MLILPQISTFNPTLTCICLQVHHTLIPFFIKTSLKRIGWSPGYDSSLLKICLDREDSPSKNNLLLSKVKAALSSLTARRLL